jgi:hypothetical protein
MLAEVQDILTGLVLEYLRSTFHLASAVRVPQPTYLEPESCVKSDGLTA